jgi:hypothetical protein
MSERNCGICVAARTVKRANFSGAELPSREQRKILSRIRHEHFELSKPQC